MAFKMKRNKGNFPFKTSPLKLLMNPQQVDIDDQLEHAAGNAARDYKGIFDRHILGNNATGGNFTEQPGYIAPNLHKVQQANRTLEHRMSIITDRMNKRADGVSGKTAKLNKILADKDNDPNWTSGKYSMEEYRNIQMGKLGMKSKSDISSKTKKATDKIKRAENYRSDYDNTKV